MAKRQQDSQRKSGEPYVNERGELCIGSDCVSIRVPEKGPIQVDLSECDESTRKHFTNRLVEGADTEYKVGRVDRDEK